MGNWDNLGDNQVYNILFLCLGELIALFCLSPKNDVHVLWPW